MKKYNIIWGKTKIWEVTQLPQWKIDDAEALINMAISEGVGFAYDKCYEYDENNKRFIPDNMQATYKLFKSNYQKISSALRLLHDEGIILRYTLTPTGTLNIKYWEEYVKPEELTCDKPGFTTTTGEPGVKSDKRIKQEYVIEKQAITRRRIHSEMDKIVEERNRQDKINELAEERRKEDKAHRESFLTKLNKRLRKVRT